MRLVLAKHALPDMSQDVPASQWHLGEAGREGARRLGESLRTIGFDIAEVACSTEPKALQTATIACNTLGLAPPCSNEGLREHHRETPGFLTTDEFQARARALFAEPDALAWGEETANQARDRFTAAIDDILCDRLLVVAHGTVISLYVEQLCGVDGWEIWSSLGLPSFVVVDVDARRIDLLVTSV